MKKQNVITLLLLVLFLGSFAQERNREGFERSEKDMGRAVDIPTNTNGFSLEVQWEHSISEVCALPANDWYNVAPRGVATDGTTIYITADNISDMYKYDLDGNYLGAEAGAPGVGAIEDLSLRNGEFMGGWWSETIHIFDHENSVYINAVVASVSNGIQAWDDENEIIYSMGTRNTGYDNPFNVITEDGELLYSFPRENNHMYSGLAYDPRVPCLWGLSNNTSSKNTLVQISLPSGQETGVVFELPEILATPTVGKPAGGLSLNYIEDTDTYLLVGMVTERYVWGIELILEEPLETDPEALSIVAPLTAMNITGSHPVEFRLKNSGNSSISNIDVSCSIDGGSPGSYTVEESIEAGEYLDVVLPINVQFTDVNESHEIEINIDYPGDDNEENNTIVYEVENIEPYYYQSNSYCAYGDGILSFELGDISNLNTGCTNNGYEDYTDMSTNALVGSVNTAYIATAGPDQFGYMWIDFNKDFFFDNETELVTDQFPVPDGGLHPVEFTIPEGTEPGVYRLRASVEWVLEGYPFYPNAQVDMGYGEMEDYTLIITDELIELDAGIYELNIEPLIRPNTTIPVVTVKNYGESVATFDVTATCNDYSSTITVNNLASKATELVEFDEMSITNADYTIEFCTELVGDEIPDNDCLDQDFRVCDLDRETVLLEIGTGTWCGFCPGAALGADELYENGKDVSIIEYHAGDNYAINDGVDRVSYYDISAFPTSVFDGTLRYEGGSTTGSIYNEMLPLYEEAIDLPSAYGIEIDLEENSELDYQLFVTVENEYDFEDDNLKLFAVLTESHIDESWQILDELNFVARAVYPNGGGESIEFSNGVYDWNTNITVPENYVLENCKLNVFVQDMDTKEVWQSTSFGFNIVGQAELAGNNQFHIYPNPATDLLKIRSDEMMNSIMVFNSRGQIVMQQEVNLNSAELELQFLNSGIYFVRIITGKETVMQKIIIER